MSVSFAKTAQVRNVRRRFSDSELETEFLWIGSVPRFDIHGFAIGLGVLDL